jgi:hypothetical protein
VLEFLLEAHLGTIAAHLETDIDGPQRQRDTTAIFKKGSKSTSVRAGWLEAVGNEGIHIG